MAGFLCCIEGHQAALTAADLERYGLSYVTDDHKPPYNAEWPVGPGGKPGWGLADERRLDGFAPSYRPDEQVWRKRAGPSSGPEIYIGHYRDARPTRDSLARGKQLRGLEVELADGPIAVKYGWQVPLVRHCLGAVGSAESAIALPTYMDLDDAGQPIPGEVVAEHRWLVDLVTPFWEAWLAAFLATPAGESFTVDLPDLYPMAAGLLQANYAIGLTECAMLKLWRSDYGAADVLRAACDTDWAMVALGHLQKKTAPPTESSPASAAAASSSSAGDAA